MYCLVVKAVAAAAGVFANMNLLPKSHKEFSQTEYWDSFFKKRGQKSFEWYGEYPELCGYIHKYSKPQDNVLVLGCGNSSLSADLYDVGYKHITSVDISKVVIKQMQQLHSKQRPELKFIEMDVLDMTFSDSDFTLVLDKGTLDALMPDESPEVVERVTKMFQEVDRVLKLCGRYIIVSLLQEHILQALLNFFCPLGWLIRINRCTEAEKKEGASSGLAVFVIVCTKVKLPGSQSVLEFSASSTSTPTRLKDMSAFISTIKDVQNSALVCSRVSAGDVSEAGPISLDLFAPHNSNPRYTVHIVDKPGAKGAKWTFAVFIVPQGGENEWMFASDEGREWLRKSANMTRLAVVILHRGHEFPNLKAVQDELEDCATQLAPKNLSGKIQFLSIGKDIGERKQCFRSTSEISGDFVVEEVRGGANNEEIFRRLIFLSSPHIVQSEARLKKSKNGKSYVVDTDYLACEHHLYMSIGVSSGLAAVSNNEGILIIGLGGGALCTFIHNSFSKAQITAVDIDPAMKTVASSWFGLPRGKRMECVVKNGLSYLTEASAKGRRFAAVLFDVDSKDTSLGLSCPPRDFLRKDVLVFVSSLLEEKGVFVLNLVCRSDSVKSEVMQTLQEVFSSIASYKLKEEVNEVLFCWKEKLGKNAIRKNVRSSAETLLNKSAEKRNVVGDDRIDVTQFMTSLKLT